MDPLIFNIQKFSTHDGDGVRTTIFFKGCPLRCKWCHNPESQSYQKEMVLYRHKCTACGTCVKKCPNHANAIVEGQLLFDRSKCTACGACIDWCITEAREIAGKEYTVAELVKEAKKDQIFYDQSGGGVTLSGGEVMAMQNMDFVEELCRRLHAEGISVYIDTSGFAPYENFERLLPYVDVFLYDIKRISREEHLKYIGVDNTMIKENLIKLSDAGAGLYIRIPVIGGVNSSPTSIMNAIRFLKENHINVRQINLLPYHDIGKNKYAGLDRGYEDSSMMVPSKEHMESLKELFEEHGFRNVRVGG